LHAVQQVLATNLHHKDKHVAEFATNLLDDIEDMKSTDPGLNTDEAIAILSDDDTAQAYLESFATKIFLRADNEIHNKQTTKATPQKLLAASQFFDLLRVFKPELEPDVSDKIRYAKFHAARILKAYKNGDDPDDYEPPKVDEPDEEQELAELNAMPDEPDAHEQQQTLTEQGIDELDLPTAPGIAKEPEVPPLTGDSDLVELPSAPPIMPTVPDLEATELPDIPKAPSRQPLSKEPATSRPARRHSSTSSAKHITKQEVQHMMNESEVVSAAQKNAKFAISALNYDDMDTAIKELREALSLLETYKKTCS
jgi:vacuolar protein sorting-associated protein VTA1